MTASLISLAVGVLLVFAWESYQAYRFARLMYVLMLERSIHGTTPPTTAEIWINESGAPDHSPLGE